MLLIFRHPARDEPEDPLRRPRWKPHQKPASRSRGISEALAWHQIIHRPISDTIIQETVANLRLVSYGKVLHDNLPGLLTSLQAMWLLDLREPPEETRNKLKRDDRVKKPSPKLR